MILIPFIVFAAAVAVAFWVMDRKLEDRLMVESANRQGVEQRVARIEKQEQQRRCTHCYCKKVGFNPYIDLFYGHDQCCKCDSIGDGPRQWCPKVKIPIATPPRRQGRATPAGSPSRRRQGT